MDINSAVGRKAGLGGDKLQAVAGNDLSLFSDVERLVIALADALTDTPSNVSDALYTQLRDRFSEEQLIELGAQIAFEQYRARFNRLFDVGSDELYHPGGNGGDTNDGGGKDYELGTIARTVDNTVNAP